MPANYVSPEKLAEHQAHIRKLEEELQAERNLRREADGEIIKLRATVNGVQLNDGEVHDLLAKQLESAPTKMIESNDDGAETEDDEEEVEPPKESMNGAPAPSSVAPEVTGADVQQERLQQAKTPQPDPSKRPELEQTRLSQSASDVMNALNKLGLGGGDKINRRNFLLKSPSEYLPMIRRGFTRGAEDEDDAASQVISVGWKVEVRNRKEREELLRDEVDRFEIKMKRFSGMLEEGIDVTMWQLSRKVELGGQEKDEFGLKSTAVSVQLMKRGDLYVQSQLNFTLRGGYLSKAIGRRKADKAALEPLALYDILEVKAGCSGYDHNDLPSSGKSKTKKSKGDNRQSSLFLTIKATPTPEASFRSYILKFKSRGARNDTLNGLRSMLADMQIHEGVSISSMQNTEEEDDDETEIMVPLSEVHNAINREREAYDRLLLLLLQGQEDLKEKEDELLSMRGKLETVMEESSEKDRVQANDSRLIMQLSKKLETLLMDNEDLRDQNDRLNSRLVVVECEKMNLMSN
mmetsp:Transcript_13456/g.19394  ORF Transcript_13456/g.19394 Transcript_13456/m.19394 type:complete len:521 (-) Transcript_13456:463-2025(-)